MHRIPHHPLGTAILLCIATLVPLVGCGQRERSVHMDIANLDSIKAETRDADQVLVVDLWATWCAPCMTMFGPLHEGIASLGDDARLISVSYDDPKIWDTKVKKFLEEHHAMEDAYLLAEGEAGDAFNSQFDFNVEALPVVLIYTPDGQLAHAFQGGKEAFDAEDVVEKVREIIAPAR